MRRAIALAMLVVVAAVVALTAAEVALGHEELQAADVAAATADWPNAIAHARAAAEAQAPGSPWPQRGMLRLSAIGHDAEARGDDATALLAYGAMRTAALATRAPGTGSTAWRSKAEEGLARAAASRQDSSAPRVTADAMRAALAEDDVPPTARLALLAAGTLSMLGGLASLVRPKTDPRRNQMAQGAAVLGFVAYVAALLMN
jgi:hypothetical protein